MLGWWKSKILLAIKEKNLIIIMRGRNDDIKTYLWLSLSFLLLSTAPLHITRTFIVFVPFFCRPHFSFISVHVEVAVITWQAHEHKYRILSLSTFYLSLHPIVMSFVTLCLFITCKINIVRVNYIQWFTLLSVIFFISSHSSSVILLLLHEWKYRFQNRKLYKKSN